MTRRLIFTYRSLPRELFYLASVMLLFFCFPGAAFSQIEDDIEPPPVKAISKEEKEKLDAHREVKKRTDLSLELMDARLKSAELLVEEKNYREALNSLATFQALLEDALNFLATSDPNKNRVINNYKKLEISLRRQTPRIEVIRRGMPYRFGVHVQKLIKFVRDARSKAVEPLYSDSIVPNDSGF